MKQIIVEGGQRLEGKIEISGMKNSALPVIFACLLIKGDCILENIPMVSDVINALTILEKMGSEVERISAHSVRINTEHAAPDTLDFELVSKMRASSYLMSTCLTRYNEITMPYPGGCNFGARPIEQHLKGFSAFGAICEENFSEIRLKYSKKPKSTKIILDKISVGATINMVMASVLLDGETVIENVAKEPHVTDLICFLSSCGANIRTNGNKILVKGVKSLHGVRYRIYSDMIEALTFITCAGVTGGELLLENSHYAHVESLVPMLQKMRYTVLPSDNGIYVKAAPPLSGADVTTAPYPCFPTDLHPQFSALLCYCHGGGSVTENIFSGRFAYTAELEKMGAMLKRKGDTVRIYQSKLHGASLDATDLRAGAALVVAALGADGISTINNVNYIVRGYENLVSKLSSVGGDIKIKGE